MIGFLLARPFDVARVPQSLRTVSKFQGWLVIALASAPHRSKSEAMLPRARAVNIRLRVTEQRQDFARFIFAA